MINSSFAFFPGLPILLPVDWRRGWPQILPPHTPVPLTPMRPSPSTAFIVDRSHWRDGR
ncbi:MAG TPA: hypothetical protein VNV61_17075 [Steroidobacteraceae bacterium]|nr:hypothetical protein [Steroidobacteraceae bacterium]